MSNLMIEIYNQQYGCLENRWLIKEPFPEEISHYIAGQPLANGLCIELEPQEPVPAFLQAYLLDQDFSRIIIREELPIDRLSYQNHNGRELSLMLSGIKPLSFFYDEKTFLLEEAYPYHYFQPYVQSGEIIFRQLEDESFISPGCMMLLYALPAEVWRFDAFIDHVKQLHQQGWNPELERREGELLGYTPSQIEEYLAYLQQVKNGLATPGGR